MSEEEVKTHERIACLETKVDLMMSNHLPHIQKKIDDVSARVWWILGTLILGFLTTIVIMLVKIFV